jgi:enoyl-CoA hydratase/carnithine racemase
MSRDMAGLLAFTRLTGELIANMRACKLPIVASVKRVAAGAGAVMALACDLRVMGNSAFFAFLFPQVGLSGADMGASYLLPRVVGLGLASEILMTGDRIHAPRCEQIGLANRVVADEDPARVDAESFELARRLANGPHFALRMTKVMLQSELGLGLPEAIEAEAQAQAVCMQHADFREANEAWAAHRAPRWT